MGVCFLSLILNANQIQLIIHPSRNTNYFSSTMTYRGLTEDIPHDAADTILIRPLSR